MDENTINETIDTIIDVIRQPFDEGYAASVVSQRTGVDYKSALKTVGILWVKVKTGEVNDHTSGLKQVGKARDVLSKAAVEK